MKLYSKNLIVNLLEARLLDAYEDYCLQGQYNNTFISYLYKYIRENTYTGEHDALLRQLVNLQLNDDEFKEVRIKENTDRQTYTLTSDVDFTDSMRSKLALIVKEYYNYKYTILSENRIEFKVKFGWLPPNTASWLNLLNDECLIDYYIDGITLRKNTYSQSGGRPDSGYVCYRIDSVQEYDTVMFVADTKYMEVEDNVTSPKFTVASLLSEIQGTKGATLNRIVDFDLNGFFYELGPYNRNYLSAKKTSLIIQVPYDFAVGDYFYLYDVSNSVQINPKNNADENNQDNFFVAFSNENFDSMFLKYALKDISKLVDKILNSEKDKLSESLQQYLFGDFIWRTSDSKLIAYVQNLVNSLYGNSQLVSNGVWSDALSSLITKYKTNTESTFFDDDVIDKATEEAMLAEYKLNTGLDPNEELFNQW